MDLIAAPYWKSAIMHGESLLFVKDSKALPRARLLFPPHVVHSLTSADETHVYEPERDYTLDPSVGVITLPKGSDIPFRTIDEMYPPPRQGARDEIHQIGASTDGTCHLLFGEGHFFHDMQCAITYQHDGQWYGPVPRFAGQHLPLSVAALETGRPLRLALYGDSISEGANASGRNGAPPHQPPFGSLVVANLTGIFGSPITYSNHSRAGWNTNAGLQNISTVADFGADLVILAYGMNDAGALSPDLYIANIQAMIQAIRTKRPVTEFILVASMSGNPHWNCLQHERFPAYREALNGLCGSGIALADLTSIWTFLLTRKNYTDLTGNGVNHPNDFGHRIYAQTILGLLVRSMTE